MADGITTARAETLLAWYDVHARDLPWRVGPPKRRAGVRPDPYRVWLSEVMLQQTTVAAATGHFLRFAARWPDVHALASAPREEVLGTWAGLGYYARARNLHACAQVVSGELGGRFPDHRGGLEGAARRRPVHGGGHRSDRLRPAGGRRGRQCRARDGAALRRGGAVARRQAAPSRARGPADAPRTAGRLRTRSDGPGRHGLHAGAAGLPGLPLAPGLPGACPWHRRGAAPPRAETGEAGPARRRLARGRRGRPRPDRAPGGGGPSRGHARRSRDGMGGGGER